MSNFNDATFYVLMQDYRLAVLENPEAVSVAYGRVLDYVKAFILPTHNAPSAQQELALDQESNKPSAS